MNAYDFDKTIYIRDSSVDFTFYCLKKHPLSVLRALPALAVRGVQYALRRCDFKTLKEAAFSYLRYLPDVDAEAKSYWEQNRSGIADWYLAQRREDDVIISASSEFLLRPIAEQLGAELIATRMDAASGEIFGKNCHDSEKVRRFYEKHPGAQIEEFYSDSSDDSPMAQIAVRAYRVKKGKVMAWK